MTPKSSRTRNIALLRHGQAGLRRLASDESFPFYFFLRNIDELENERWWKPLSPRMKRARLMKMLKERVAIVREVKKWLSRQGNCARLEPAEDSREVAEIACYCTNCGMCCETASGFPDFPLETKIPEQWQKLFGDGLGRGHRFCPFLWESKTPRGSLCSIHPWRSNPCRIFERDDCDFVRQDPGFKDLSDRRDELIVARRRLFHLINAR